MDETLVSANSVSGPACCKAEGVDKSSTIQQIGSASSPASKPDSVTYACDIDGVQEHVDHLSPLNADHLMVLQL